MYALIAKVQLRHIQLHILGALILLFLDQQHYEASSIVLLQALK